MVSEENKVYQSTKFVFDIDDWVGGGVPGLAVHLKVEIFEGEEPLDNDRVFDALKKVVKRAKEQFN